MPRVCFIGHKAESLNCQVGRDMTTSTTEAIFNPPYPRIVKFMQGEEDFGSEVLQCGMSILVCPLSAISFMQGKAESHQLGCIIKGHLC